MDLVMWGIALVAWFAYLLSGISDNEAVGLVRYAMASVLGSCLGYGFTVALLEIIK